ncbi:MAG: PilT/PilU family type 4a pilus ATPase [Bdellovibrionota bacterium]
MSNISEAKKSAPSTPPKVDMHYLVRALLKYNASDLHLKVGRSPIYRINGKLVPAKLPELTTEQAEEIIFSVIPEKRRAELESNRQVDLSFRVKDMGRFRVNAYYQRGTISAAIRMIPLTLPNFEELGIPLVLKELVQRPRGLFLITGSTGSGKSTTLAGLIQYLNETSHVHVLSLEDPIEFVYRDMKASITQREVGSDINNIRDGLYAGLRQDPDVVVIGEMRDYETIQLALTAAETGRLVLATLHTNDAKSSIDRIMDVFPPEAKNQIRIQLASTLIGVMSQQLLVRADGTGRVPACEVMIKSPAIESFILKNETNRIQEAIANSNNYYKMQSMSQGLEKLVLSGIITADEAVKASSNPDDLKLRLSGIVRDQGYEMQNSGSVPPPPISKAG